MNRQGPELLAGTRVRLRRSTLADAHVVHLMARDPEVARYMRWAAHTRLAEAESFLAGRAVGWETGREFHWMIEALATREPVGCLGCRVHGASADFGCLLVPHAWGHGYASDACSTLVAWLAAQGVARIWAAGDHENARWAAVLERVGLAREGVLRAAAVRPNLGGPPRDALVHALCLDEG